MPVFEGEKWNKSPEQESNSCYNYALDMRSSGKKGKNLNPGDASKRTVNTPFFCRDVIAALVADGLEETRNGACGSGCWKIVCLRGPRMQPDPDIHFYRQDDDGTWSHKRGDDRATNKGKDGNPITDPEKDGRAYGYTERCGSFCVCPEKLRKIDVALAEPATGARSFAALTFHEPASLATAGLTIDLPPGKVTVVYDFELSIDDAEPARPEVVVTACVYSTRANPRWTLSVDETAELRKRLPHARDSLYRGAAELVAAAFVIRNDGAVKSVPRVVRVGAAVIGIGKDDGTEECYPDTRGLGAWLLTLALTASPCYGEAVEAILAGASR
jgi:hypothetical protein